MLAALMALTFVQQNYAVDSSRIYISGMSGGGRIASMTITLFPDLFTGALYIVGADFWTATDPAVLARITEKRYVFLTGAKDFNRNEMRQVYRRYLNAGATHSLLMDLPRLGHEYPNAAALDTAIQFLDADHISKRE
jgi:predicted esterase